MTEMSVEMRNFLTNQSEEDKAKAQKATDASSSTQSSLRVGVSGKYRMRVRNFYAVKNNVETVFPKVEISSKKKSLMLTIMLETVDGTELVPAGSTTLHNITLMPAPGSSDELYANTAKMSKPQLCALLGIKDIKITDYQWLFDNVGVEYKDKKIVKDHKMKEEVMVEMVDDWYNNALKIKVNGGSIRPAMPGEKSKSNTPPADAGTAVTDGVVIKSDDSREEVDSKVIESSALHGIGDDELIEHTAAEEF